jgi:hypothetical protein
MGAQTNPLKRFIDLANAAKIELGPCDPKLLLKLPEAEVTDRAERLRDTPLYVKGNPFKTLGNYSRARQARYVLLQIASTGEDVKRRIDGRKKGRVYVSQIPSPANSEKQLLRSLRTELPTIKTHYYAEIGSDGRISISEEEQPDTRFFAELSQALTGGDATAIRHCGWCGLIFWAERRDKVYCSSGCRQRDWRKKYPERTAEIQNHYDQKRGRAAGAKDGNRIAGEKADRKHRTHPPTRAPRLPGNTKQTTRRKLDGSGLANPKA